MRLDTHLHVALRPFLSLEPVPVEKLLDELARHGFDGGWISSTDALTTRDLEVQKRSNDSLADMARRYPGRVGGFGTVDPGGMDDAAREVERCARELGLTGIKLHPWLQAFSVVHPGVALIMEAAGAAGMPVLFHDGTPPYSAPSQIGWLADRFPGTTVILGHCGLVDLWREALGVARMLPNVWLQPCAAPPIAIRAALQAVGPDRILFGSDGGFGPDAVPYNVDKFVSALGEEVFERIVRDNPGRVLQAARRR